MKTLEKYYHHIDNGGISIEVKQDQWHVEVELGTSYFGYPSITSNLQIVGLSDTKKILREMGEVLIRASEKIETPEE